MSRPFPNAFYAYIVPQFGWVVVPSYRLFLIAEYNLKNAYDNFSNKSKQDNRSTEYPKTAEYEL